MDFNEDIIVYAIYKGEAHWYITYKELWYLNHHVLIEAYRKRGLAFDINLVDEIRRDLLGMDDNQIPIFLERIKNDICSNEELEELYNNNLDEELFPSLYVDFDKKKFISMYNEMVSYEDYMPDGWDSEYGDFWPLIPPEDIYWGNI